RRRALRRQQAVLDRDRRAGSAQAWRGPDQGGGGRGLPQRSALPEGRGQHRHAGGAGPRGRRHGRARGRRRDDGEARRPGDPVVRAELRPLPLVRERPSAPLRRDCTHMGKVACFAEYAVVPEQGCVPAPAALDFPQLALIGCSVTTGVGAAVFNARVQPGDTVVVIGCGGVGLNVLQGARISGATTIIAVDVKDAALTFAKKFGATHVVNARTEKAVERVQALTGGGAHFAFEAYGSGATTRMAVDMLRKRGTAVIVGIAPMGDAAAIEPVVLTRGEKTLTGTYYGSAHPRQDMPRIADWVGRGLIDVAGLVQRRYTLAEINRAYEDIDTDAVGRGVLVFA